MPAGKYPFPGDSPVVQARRVANAYRHLAYTLDPEATAALDARVLSWGQHWAAPNSVAWPEDAWITAAQAAEVACVAPGSIGELRRRGRLRGRPRTDGRGYEYRAGDIYALKSVRRRQRATTTVTINANGTTVSAAGEATP